MNYNLGMIYSSIVLSNKLSVNSKYSKMSLMEKNGEIVRLKRGLYTDNPTKDYLASSSYIHTPSYISFEFALAHYGLIPERVVEITCATIFAEHKLRFTNKCGRYSYRNTAPKAFPLDVIMIDGSLPYYIASKEKCLLDMIYIKGKCRNKKQIEELLFEDLRIDENEFSLLDFAKLNQLCDFYPGDSIRVFKNYIKDKYL